MSRWGNKYVIGLTGNIAVGKSVVRQMLQHLGAYTIDADGLSHRAMAPGAPCYKPIISTFGQFILNPDKTINRAMLGQIVFSNPEALQKLEAITHPVVRGAIDVMIKRAQQRVIVIEAIKLLEGDMAKDLDAIWVVDAKPQTQLQRLVGKRKMSEADAKQRIAAQPAQTGKVSAATVVINNDGNVEDTWKQVQIAWGEIRKTLTGSPPDVPETAKPAAPAPAKPTAPAPAKPAAPAPAKPAAPAGAIEVKRGMPGNAEAIANFINKAASKTLTRTDIMMAFGEKSYLLAHTNAETVVAVMGFQVENLITSVNEFYLTESAPIADAVGALVLAVEEASVELQSEVNFIFLPKDTPETTVQSFLQNGYVATTVDQIKIPAWREAVQEAISDELQVLRKQLREDRILKPI